METVGVYLKKERESKNLSLGEVSRLTKISELYLEYIEKDEFEKLPQGPYAKGYIASYSRLIGGNVDEAIALYEALNRKRIQTEDVQPDITKRNGTNGLPEKPKATERKKPTGSWFGKAKSLFNTVVSSVPINRFSFKSAGTSIKNISTSARINKNWLENVFSSFKKITSSWTWLYAFIALLGIAILVLAGFGFYHLFVYDPNPLTVAELQHVQEKEKSPLPVIGSETPVLPSESTGAHSTTDQLDGHTKNTKRPQPANPPEAQKQSTTPSTDLGAMAPITQLETDHSSGTSKIAARTGTSLSGSWSTGEIADSSQTHVGTENPMRSGQSEMTAGLLPESTAAEADLTVLQASVCAEIKDRMPAGVDTSFPTSAQRVFVWSEIEARQIPSKIRHIYYLNGEKISDVTLDVRSAYWRTWSAKSISDDRYRGEWRVDITTAGGKVLRRLYFVVR